MEQGKFMTYLKELFEPLCVSAIIISNTAIINELLCI